MAPTDSTTIQPPLDYSDDGPGLIIGSHFLGSLATIVVALRFWARRLTRQPVGADDYLCLAALITHHVVLTATRVCVQKGGIGRDMRITSTEDPESVVILFQVWSPATVSSG